VGTEEGERMDMETIKKKGEQYFNEQRVKGGKNALQLRRT